MKNHIVCLGDSNTHGYCADPADCADPALARFNESERWTCLLQKGLGEYYQVVEEGLSGRTTAFIGEGMLTHPPAVAATGGMGQACVEKSKGISAQYKQAAQDMGCHFLDVGGLGCKMNRVDFMHLTRAGHAVLAEVLAKLAPTLV